MKNVIAESLSKLKVSKTSIAIAVFAIVLLALQFRSFVLPVYTQVKSQKTAPEVALIDTTEKDQAVHPVEFAKIEEPGMPKRMVVPSLSLGLPIVTVPMEKGTWKVEEGVANFAEESSPFNGDVGNSVLYGHNKSDAFKPLDQLKTGDRVYVQTSLYQFTYEVFDVSTTGPKNVEVMKPGDKRELTLITCNGYFDEKRLIIKAELKEITQLN